MSALHLFDQHDQEKAQQEADWQAWQRAEQMAEADGRAECLTRAEMDERQQYYFERYRALQRQYGSQYGTFDDVVRSDKQLPL